MHKPVFMQTLNDNPPALHFPWSLASWHLGILASSSKRQEITNLVAIAYDVSRDHMILALRNLRSSDT